MPNLEYHHIKIGEYKNTNQMVIKGEVTNNSGKSYSAVAVRVIVFIKNIFCKIKLYWILLCSYNIINAKNYALIDNFINIVDSISMMVWKFKMFNYIYVQIC